MIRLEDIDPGNWRLGLKVTEEQTTYAADRAAVGLVLDALKQDGRYDKVVLCCIEGNNAARKLYEQFGFAETERDEDEIVMELVLNQ